MALLRSTKVLLCALLLLTLTQLALAKGKVGGLQLPGEEEEGEEEEEEAEEEEEEEEEPENAALKNLRTQLQNLTDGMVKQSRALKQLNAKVFNIKVEVEEEDGKAAPMELGALPEEEETEEAEESEDPPWMLPDAEKGKCKDDTGGTCKMLYCYAWRGPTTCESGKCLCEEGYCSVDGKCVKQDADAETSAPASFVHHGTRRHRREHNHPEVVHRRVRVPKTQRLSSVTRETDASEDLPVPASEERPEDTVENRHANVAAPTANGVLSVASTLRDLATTWASEVSSEVRSEAAAAAASAATVRPARLLRGFAGDEGREQGAPSMATEIRKSEEGPALLQKNRHSHRIRQRDDSDESDVNDDELLRETISDEEEAAEAEAELVGNAGAAELTEARDSDVSGSEDLGSLEIATDEGIRGDDASSALDDDDSSSSGE
mmetsp:Transcript_112898/g.199276  ORF Transcript_112898/g.199276 Transcript_112898/m.199276 type:complete len:435 (+) Transcript_112898:102-1406(+)